MEREVKSKDIRDLEMKRPSVRGFVGVHVAVAAGALPLAVWPGVVPRALPGVPSSIDIECIGQRNA